MIELVQHGLVDDDRRVEAVDGTRAVVEQVGYRIELSLAVNRQVGAFGQVPLMARSNSPTRGHPKFPQAGRPDYDDSGLTAMRAAASFRR